MFNQKSILITGGTGSFGTAFIKKTLINYPLIKRIVVFSRDELKQSILQDSFNNHDLEKLRFFLGDVRDYDRLVFALKNIDYVIHAAALKQVPAAEYNPMEFVKTNVHGAENLIKACISQNVEKIIALSTDKAANPINLYGATKLVSDKLFISANNNVGQGKTRFSVVRYGNVVGSRGSVVPFYKKLLKENKSYLPITHESMTRFWILLSEGIDFVMDSFKRMKGGEIFVPKLPSVKIVDLAKAMAPNLDYKIIGIRPGEKIHEIMCPQDYSHLTLEFDTHYVIKPSIKYIDENIDFTINNANEKGKLITLDFEYNSGSNPKFLNNQEILDYNDKS